MTVRRMNVGPRAGSGRVKQRRTYRAPGRVNLIGGQVDYHEGWVVSLAIDRDVVIEASTRPDGRIVARSADFDGQVDIAADGSNDPPATRPEWGRAIAGVARVLAEMGRAPVGADLDVSSTVPVGAGLSSSAAFEVACALALADSGRTRAPWDSSGAGRAALRARCNRRAVRGPGPDDLGPRTQRSRGVHRLPDPRGPARTPPDGPRRARRPLGSGAHARRLAVRATAGRERGGRGSPRAPRAPRRLLRTGARPPSRSPRRHGDGARARVRGGTAIR